MRFFPRTHGRRALSRPRGRPGSSCCGPGHPRRADRRPTRRPWSSVLLPTADDDLRDRQRHLRHELNAAHHDLDESSARARRTALALETARTDLSQAQDALSIARAKVTAARIRDREMQRELDAAVARLAQARTDLKEGQLDVARQRREIGDLLADTYQQGDPHCSTWRRCSARRPRT